MIKKGRAAIKNHMTMEYRFSGIRIQDGALTPVDWEMTVDLLAAGPKTKTKEEIEYSASIAYQRVYFWLDTNLPNIIMVDVSNETDLYLANLSSNIMMYCPDSPSDDILIQLLHAKITALATPELIVGEIHLKGSDTSLKYTFDCTNGVYMLPSTTAEYYAENSTRDTVPWWFRSDGFCFEFVRPPGTEATDEELFNGIVDPMDEFNKVVNELSETHVTVVREPAKIVQVEKWQPKKV